jgi:hypothetical protein
MSARVFWAEGGIAGGIILALIYTLISQRRFNRREKTKFARLLQLRELMEGHGLRPGQPEIKGRGRNLIRRIPLFDEADRYLAQITASSNRPDVYLVDSDGAVYSAGGSDAGLTRLVFLALAEREIPVQDSDLDRLLDQGS